MENKKRILSVSYDEALLKTRAMILQSAGFEVTSAYGFTDALALCEKKYDLIVICHSLPIRDKNALSQSIRKNNCGQILAFRRAGTLPMEQAEWSADASRPELMLRAVCDILGVPETAPSQRKTKKPVA